MCAAVKRQDASLKLKVTISRKADVEMCSVTTF